MTSRIIASIFVVALFSAAAGAKAKPQKQNITSEGKSRTYYLFVPENVASPATLLLLLHGSGHDGMSQINEWKGLAEKEGFILAAPDSANSVEWTFSADGPEFFHDVLEAVKAKVPVNGKRVYLFGHSAGAVFGLYLGLMESQYFAAVAVHAGSLQKESYSYMEHAARKIPIAIWSGTNDRFFPLDAVRATRDALNDRGFQVQLFEMKGHDHNYYAVSGEVNKAVWEFFRANELGQDPSWERYRRQ